MVARQGDQRTVEAVGVLGRGVLLAQRGVLLQEFDGLKQSCQTSGSRGRHGQSDGES